MFNDVRGVVEDWAGRLTGRSGRSDTRRRVEAPRSVGSNGETILRLKGERALEVGVWGWSDDRCRLP